MGLRGYVARRLVYAVILIVAAMSLNFAIFLLMPGEVATLFIQSHGLSPQLTQQLIAEFNHDWGLDQPPLTRYAIYLKNMFTFNFGLSMSGNRMPVATMILIRIPWTLLLIGSATVISILLGIATGVLSAYKRGSLLDSGNLIVALMLGTVPVFWLGLVLVVIFSMDLGWFPASLGVPPGWALLGTQPVLYSVGSSVASSSSSILVSLSTSSSLTYISGILSHAFLPVLTLSIFLYGGYTLLARATMIDALTEDYIVTARAKGVSETSVLFRHALKNASLPIITAVALAFGFLFSGATITETVFSYPGLGYWIYNSVELKDFFSMQAIFYIITLMVIIANILADFLYGIVDPRIKYG
jgi:peptide/nickel transport system permease protein